MNIGILGVGVIGSAVARGFLKDGDLEHKLYLSPRGEMLGQTLEKEYAQVIRCKSNQDVLDASEVIILSVLPQKGLEILKGLEFMPDHHVINLMSDKKLDQIEMVIGKTKSLTHMVPLSFIQNREGPIAIYPQNKFVIDLVNKLGHVVAVDEVEKIESIAAITGLMTSYYRLLNDVANWGVNNNLSYEESKGYTVNFFEALTRNASRGDLTALSNEMTPGGLNEYALNYLDKNHMFEKWIETLNPMLKRVE